MQGVFVCIYTHPDQITISLCNLSKQGASKYRCESKFNEKRNSKASYFFGSKPGGIYLVGCSCVFCNFTSTCFWSFYNLPAQFSRVRILSRLRIRTRNSLTASWQNLRVVQHAPSGSFCTDSINSKNCCCIPKILPVPETSVNTE